MKNFSFILAVVNASTLGSAFMITNTELLSRTCIQSTAENTLEQTTMKNAVTIAEMKCEAGGSILDEAAMLAEQKFPISPDELISKAKHSLVKDCGVLDPSLWADDFEFCAPYVGPLSKERFLEAADGFQIYDSFSDFDNRYFGFNVDPIEPGRVWFMTRLSATNDGLGLFGKKEPSNKTVVLPPQMYSFLFTEGGLIRELTVGYPVDRRQGNTGGLGGMFGVFYGVGQGLPFPEGKPYQLSRRFRLFTKIGDIVSNMKDKKKE